MWLGKERACSCRPLFRAIIHYIDDQNISTNKCSIGRIPNLTFSKEKDREVSYLEAKVGSVKRLLSKPAVSKQSGPVREHMARELAVGT